MNDPLKIFVGPATTQNPVVKFDGEICGGVLVENASDDFPQQKKLENLPPNFAGSSPPISPKTSPTSLWKSLVLIFVPTKFCDISSQGNDRCHQDATLRNWNHRSCFSRSRNQEPRKGWAKLKGGGAKRTEKQNLARMASRKPVFETLRKLFLRSAEGNSGHF